VEHRSSNCLRVVALASGFVLPLPVGAQQRTPTQQEVDSLRAQVRVLQTRLDSVLAVLARLPAAAQPAVQDTARRVEDELAALRAAAAAAAGRDTTRADTTTNVPFVGRERSLSQLNPEISATGDVRVYAFSPDQQRNNFDPREFEVSFQSALDPYAHTKIFVAFENGEVDIEEGYAYWTALPGRIRLDVGKFRQQIGELNRWHLHALPESEYPLVLQRFTGEEGLVDTGISLYWAAPLGGAWGAHELTAQVTRGGNEVLFEESGKPAGLLHLNNFWQLTPSTYMQIGASGVYGSNDAGEHSKLGGIDARFTWRPPAGALYREATVRGELLALRPAFSPDRTFYGGYVGATWRLNQRWIAGLRYDVVQEPDGTGTTRQWVPSLTMWQSEWVYLRGQYMYTSVPDQEKRHVFALQAVWAIGPHKHEIY
jgi:hypothetical protein